MKKTLFLLAGLAALACLLLQPPMPPVLASHLNAPTPLPVLERAVIAGGGGIQTNIYTLHATIGQPLARDELSLCAGFWCPVGASFNFFLPAILR